MKKVAIFLMGTVLSLCLFGCSGGATQSGGSKSEPKSAEQAESFESKITKEVSFSGLSFCVDPKWPRKNTDESTLRFDPSSSSVVAARTFANGETADLATYERTVGGVAAKAKDYAVIEEWSDGNISYAAYNYNDKSGGSNTYLLGYESGGKGFVIYFNRGAGSVDGVLSDSVLEKIFSTVKFSPDDMTIDSNKKDSETAEQQPAPSTPSVSASQQNALRSAKDYLDLMPFSYTGLIEQLEYEQYSTEDATYAADNCGANWNVQAEKAAKSYLDLMPFSRGELIDQLVYEGYTEEQATHGADYVGL